jgi:large subunit ribosomal protein L9e
MDIQLIKGKENKVTLAVWQGGRKHVACLRTIKSLIENMVTGVTKVRNRDHVGKLQAHLLP